MFTLDEIIRLKNEGLTVDEIIDLAKITETAEPKVADSKIEEPKVEEPKVEEPKVETTAQERGISDTQLLINKMDELMNTFKQSNINRNYTEFPEPQTDVDILATIINPYTKEEIK